MSVSEFRSPIGGGDGIASGEIRAHSTDLPANCPDIPQVWSSLSERYPEDALQIPEGWALHCLISMRGGRRCGSPIQVAHHAGIGAYRLVTFPLTAQRPDQASVLEQTGPGGIGFLTSAPAEPETHFRTQRILRVETVRRWVGFHLNWAQAIPGNEAQLIDSITTAQDPPGLEDIRQVGRALAIGRYTGGYINYEVLEEMATRRLQG